MIIVKFLIGLFLGWIIGTIIIMVLTILRCGLPMCRTELKNNKEEVNAIKKLRKKYFLAFIFWIIVIIIVSFLCYKFLSKGIYGYITSIVFMILIGFSSTGKTENNLMEFYHSLNANKDIINS